MSTCDGWHLFLQVLQVFSSFIQDLHSTGSPGVPLLKAEYTKKRKEKKERERSGSVVECLTRDRRAVGSSLTGVTALWSLSKTHLS